MRWRISYSKLNTPCPEALYYAIYILDSITLLLIDRMQLIRRLLDCLCLADAAQVE